MKLLTSQKDNIYMLIQGYGLAPSQFEIRESETISNTSTRIEFKNTEFFLDFIPIANRNDFLLKYSPGRELYINKSGLIKTFSETRTHIKQWLESIVREIEAPDYWGKLDSEINNIQIASAFDNSKFTINEFSKLSGNIEILKSRITEIPLLKEQNEQIILQLDNLKTQAEKLGKFDWTNLFIGTIMSIIIQLNVNKENANALWQLIRNIFSGYFLN
tara:strand:- start:586 stop:1236 length:651 start_codon:yes stop_codon:yes gene_type:complete